MTNSDERFDRNIRLFGKEGQRRLRESHVAIVGAGGLGTHIIQQLSLLGVGALSLIDHEEISTTNKNRYIGLDHDDPIPGTLKVDVARRLVARIDPTITVSCVAASLLSPEAFHAIKHVNHVFGCIDDDGPRFVLNDIASAYAKPYIDVATDVVDGSFGGRIVIAWTGNGCLYCFGELDQEAVRLFLERPSDRANRQAVYGIDHSLLGAAGPSVVSVNGVVASLAVTEYMMACTGMSKPKRFINYDGHKASALPRIIEGRSDCPYCRQWGHEDQMEIDRYLRI